MENKPTYTKQEIAVILQFHLLCINDNLEDQGVNYVILDNEEYWHNKDVMKFFRAITPENKLKQDHQHYYIVCRSNQGNAISRVWGIDSSLGVWPNDIAKQLGSYGI